MHANVLRVGSLAVLLAGCRPGPPPEAVDTGRFVEPAIEWAPETYVAYRASDPPRIDGRLDDPAWETADWTADFVDIRGVANPEPRLRTRAKMTWDDEFFYVAAELEEPDLWATLTERDAVIYRDNDFEMFIDPDGDTHEYYELEINALGTVWDLFLVKPYRDGGPALHGWDIRGLHTAVHLSGTLNRPGDHDSGWSIEIALPWTALREAAHKDAPPHLDDQWRVNFSRVQWRLDVRRGRYAKRTDREGEPLSEDNWVWSPQGLVNMHYPEMWGIVQFAAERRLRDERIEPDSQARARWILRRVYYREKAFHARHGRYSDDPAELGLTADRLAGIPWPLRITATPRWFEALFIRLGDTLTISADGRLR